MNSSKLTALRDFAILHLPRAQAVDATLSPDHYHRTLYGITALVGANTPATEQIAAHLLQTTLGLLIHWDEAGKLSPYQRQLFTDEALAAATELSELTSTRLPWLADAFTEPVRAIQPLPEPTPAPAAERPILRPTPTQTTSAAAAYLGVAEQTMRGWASTESGPLAPVKKGTRLGWPTPELIRLGTEGWKARGKG